MPRGQDEDFTLSPLHTFFAKVAIVTGAFLVSVYYVASVATSFATSQIDRIAPEVNKLGVNGGPAFWSAMETKLYTFAEAPDLPPEKKQKIVDAIHKLSVKYKPYIDAFAQDGQPAKPEGLRVRQ